METCRLHSVIEHSKHDYLVKNRELEGKIIELNLSLSKAESINRELVSNLKVQVDDKAQQKDKIGHQECELKRLKSQID